MISDRRWWKASDGDLAMAVGEAFDDVDMATIGRQQDLLDAYCVYGDRTDSLGGLSQVVRLFDGAITRNVIGSAVDALLSEVTQTRPRPMFVTIGGTWMDQRRASRLTYYCDAKFSECGARELMDQATRDAIVAGLGIIRPYVDHARKRVCLERVFPGHFFVDDRTTATAMPRVFYVRHILDRSHLAAMYPDHAEAIEDATAPRNHLWFAELVRHLDVVEVIEAIRLPTMGDGSDGRHAVILAGETLVDQGYTYHDPPFAFIRAIRPITGFWGEAPMNRAVPTQLELNKLLWRIQDSMHLHATAMWWVPRQAGEIKSRIVNRIGAVAQYDGPQPPIQFTPSSMAGEVYQYAAELEAKIYNLVGVSEMSATSLKPKGLNSGVALETYNDVQSRRFISLERDIEDAYTRVARLIVRLEKGLAEDDPSHEVIYESKSKRRDRIKWTELHLEEDGYRVRVFPASAFPTNPAHKIQMLENMLERGTIDVETFYELALDVPDLESARGRITAPLDLIRQRIDLIIEEGDYVDPDTYMDLERAIKEAAISLQRAEVDGAPEERIELLRQWMVQCQEFLMQAAAPTPPAGPMGPMGPEAMGPMGPMGPMEGVPPGAPPLPPEMVEMPPEMPPMPPDEGMPPGEMN